MFDEAALNAPTLLLIDDLELLCPQRSQLLSDLQRRIVSCMLTLIDGVVASPSGGGGGRVFIVATSSHPSLIDTAMRRPGRLDREVELGVPSPACRGSILNSLLSAMGLVNTQHASDLTLFPLKGNSMITADVVNTIAKNSHGMVGADLLLVCKEAHMIALDRLSGLPHSRNKASPISMHNNSLAHTNTNAGTNVNTHADNGIVDYALSAAAALKKLSLQDAAVKSRAENDESNINANIDILSSQMDLNLHLDDTETGEESQEEQFRRSNVEAEHTHEYRVLAKDLLAALGRVTPSAIREVTIEVPGVYVYMYDYKQSRAKHLNMSTLYGRAGYNVLQFPRSIYVHEIQ